jgi:GNAT superfamily N-acetyltransferase
MTREHHPIPPPGKLARAWAVLRDDGPRIFWLKLAGDLGYRRLLLLQRSLAQEIPEPAARVPVIVEILPPEAADELFACRPETARARVLQRWRAGHLCFVARHEGAVVSSCWTATANAYSEYLEYAIDLAPGDAYLFDAFTLPRYRGNGVAHAVCMRQLRYLQQTGHRRAIRMTAPENTVALRVHAKAGFRPLGSIVRVGFGRWRTIVRR